ncbi:hypothetical protein E2320_000935, partial [Naja naja]
LAGALPAGPPPVALRFDVNDPDLYIPVMAFITYLLVAGLALGTQNRFSPDLLGLLASSALAWLIVEVLAILVSLYIAAINTELTPIDLIAFSDPFATPEDPVTGNQGGPKVGHQEPSAHVPDHGCGWAAAPPHVLAHLSAHLLMLCSGSCFVLPTPSISKLFPLPGRPGCAEGRGGQVDFPGP